MIKILLISLYITSTADRVSLIILIVFVTYRCDVLTMGYLDLRQHNILCIEFSKSQLLQQWYIRHNRRKNLHIIGGKKKGVPEIILQIFWVLSAKKFENQSVRVKLL
jgi:hypothetical protein